MVKRRNNSGLMPNSSRGFDCRRILVDMNVPCGLSDLMNMMGESEEMLRLYELVGKVAATDCTILIQGDSGTGKQLIAQDRKSVV